MDRNEKAAELFGESDTTAITAPLQRVLDYFVDIRGRITGPFERINDNLKEASAHLFADPSPIIKGDPEPEGNMKTKTLCARRNRPEIARDVETQSLRLDQVRGILQGIAWIAMESDSRPPGEGEDVILCLVAGAEAILKSASEGVEGVVSELLEGSRYAVEQ